MCPKYSTLQISKQDSEAVSKSFSKCIDEGCIAMFKGSLTLKYSLKNFNKMKIAFHVSNDVEPISLTLPTEGFKEALDVISLRLNLD